jgi:hypothetical protein
LSRNKTAITHSRDKPEVQDGVVETIDPQNQGRKAIFEFCIKGTVLRETRGDDEFRASFHSKKRLKFGVLVLYLVLYPRIARNSEHGGVFDNTAHD